MRFLLILSGVLIAAMLAAGARAWLALPADAQIVVHWNADGAANGFAPKTLGLFGLPAIAAAMALLFAALPRLDPRGRNLIASRGLYGAGWLGTLGVVAAAQGATVATALGLPINIHTIMITTISIFLLVIGNFMGKSQPNTFAGIRTRWTLSSDYAWQRANRLGGRLIMLAAVATLAAMPFLPTVYEVMFFLAAILAAALIPGGLSYFYWRDDPERDKTGNAI
ncbi:MAG TPA: SdpI family protein [Rhizomicrobium sp.]